MTLHDITSGGIDALVDRLQAGDTFDQALANTTQADTGNIANVPDFTDANSFVTWFNTSADVDNYLDTNPIFSNPVGAIDGAQGANSAAMDVKDVVVNNTTFEHPGVFNYIFQDTGAD